MRFLSQLLAKWLANIGGGKCRRDPVQRFSGRQCWPAEVEFLRGMVRRNSVMDFC
jgi:hypothetical protein